MCSRSSTWCSRRWIATLVSTEETSTQVRVVFDAALVAEGLDELLTDERLDLDADDPDRPILLAVSDNGPAMTSTATRAYMTLMAIAQHHGRPHTPTHQAWIESFFGHIKHEWPHLNTISDPEQLDTELARIRVEYNTVRLHEAIGYVTPTTNTTAEANTSARPAAKACDEPANNGSTTTARQQQPHPRTPHNPVITNPNLRGRLRHTSHQTPRSTPIRAAS